MAVLSSILFARISKRLLSICSRIMSFAKRHILNEKFRRLVIDVLEAVPRAARIGYPLTPFSDAIGESVVKNSKRMC